MPKYILTKEKENHGALVAPRAHNDFVAGTLPWINLNPSANWGDFHSRSNEQQYGIGGDKMNCVTQSHHHVIEMQLNFRIQYNLLPAPHLKFLQDNGYINADGLVNLCDKFNSITNGTTMAGNYLMAVADDARKVGLIPQWMLAEKIDDPWDMYYDKNQLTSAMFAMGKKFLQYFAMPSEWVNGELFFSTLEHEMQHAPIQLVIPGHAIAGARDEVTVIDYVDSYIPFFKQRARAEFTDAMKIVLNPIINPEKGEPMVFFKVKGKSALYEFVNNSWRGYDDNKSYQQDVAGKIVKIIELDQAEFDKLTQLFPI